MGNVWIVLRWQGEEENIRNEHIALSEKWAHTGPDHQTFKAKFVRAGRDNCAVDDGLQTDGTMVFVDFFLMFFMFCIELEIDGHRRRRFLHAVCSLQTLANDK